VQTVISFFEHADAVSPVRIKAHQDRLDNSKTEASILCFFAYSVFIVLGTYSSQRL